MEESSDKATTLKKAYAEMILNTAKESAARVLVSDRKSARFHHDLCGTKDEALRLLVRLKQMIDAKTIEAEITSSNQQRQIDVLEAQLQEAEEIITDLRSELRWVRDKIEKAKEQETISSHSEVVIVASLNSPKRDMSESLMNQSLLNDDECGGNDEKSVETSKGCDDDCESELDANIRNEKLELSRNGCTQRIRALESKTSPCVKEEEQRAAVKRSGENLSSGKTRCLVLALRARNAEVITAKPLDALGIKKSCKLRGRRKRKWSKGKAKPVRSQSQLIKPCQSQSDLPCYKTFMENSDGMDMNLSVENEEVGAHKAGILEIETKKKPLSHLNPVVRVNATNGSTDDDLKSKEETALVKCDGEEDSVIVQSTKMGSELVNPWSDFKATAVVVSNQISKSPRAEGNRLVKYTFQRKRKRDL